MNNVLLLTLVVVVSSVNVGALRIGAFNIQTLGRTKYSKDEVMSYIYQILRRYDVVLVQEIRDASGVVIPGILSKLRSTGEGWGVVQSARLGRSSYKEQYAYYYRTDKVTVEETYQYDDGVDDGTDEFSREPYGVLVSFTNSGALKKFGMVGAHIAPREAVTEMDSMADVFEAAMQTWQIDDIMAVGDFNADCSYITSNELKELVLRQDTSYWWLIGDNADTTVSSTDCAYDRIIVTGDVLKSAIDNARVFKFDEAYHINEDLARDISDHYPVEVEIRTTP